ncbi:MAG: TonB-dependent receptor [Verrucomicrobiales bacterium]|nr:TonB-dependent receptor [Verrucomicrobiales bacterium]
MRHILQIFLLLGLALTRWSLFAAEESRTNNLPGELRWRLGRVSYQGPAELETDARPPQPLALGSSLRTSASSQAKVVFIDRSWLTLQQLTRLVLVPRPARTNLVGVRLLQGTVHYGGRGQPSRLEFETPGIPRAAPNGTEFTVSVDAVTGVSTFTMFDGEVDLVNEVDHRRVRRGQTGTSRGPRVPIEVRPILESRSIVQWWIHYPGVLDPAELGLHPPAESPLAQSLEAYAQGDLLRALQLYPDYPDPQIPTDESQRIYLAALLLGVGEAEGAAASLESVAEDQPLARALRTVIRATSLPLQNSLEINQPSAVSSTESPTYQTRTSVSSADVPASLHLAESYAYQSTHDLPSARRAAQQAVALSPRFAWAWARLAELEFAFGRTREAHSAIRQALLTAGKNAQAQAILGFLLAAENRVDEALQAFETAIAIDPRLANGWLGRGLCRLRRAHTPEEVSAAQLDLETASANEPSRSLLRSYAGRSFARSRKWTLAEHEFARARDLDPDDPTSWLYSALALWEQNQLNRAVSDLQQSIVFNDNRAVYRSSLLLHTDQAVRSASLARLYRDAYLPEVGLREAARAVAFDYANPSAHQFLAESFDALRDPSRTSLRSETAWFNELLLANVLSPPGSGLLSQNISQHEYSRLFEADGLRLLNTTEVQSQGRIRQTTAQSGAYDRTAWALDLDYHHDAGALPNTDLGRLEINAQLKQQISDRDSLYFLAKYQEFETGDVSPKRDPAQIDPRYRTAERQAPMVLGFVHREWQPGLHTTLMAGHLQSHIDATGQLAPLDLRTNIGSPAINCVLRPNFLDSKTDSHLDTWATELNQIWQTDRQVLVLGSRFQAGTLDVASQIDGPQFPVYTGYYGAPILTRIEDPFHRVSVYAYETVEMIPDRVRLTGGLGWDDLAYPANFRTPPFSSQQRVAQQLSPKTALLWNVTDHVALRGMYSRSLGGLSYEESVRLEPTQLAGFEQNWRSLIPEAVAGSVVAPEHQVGGLALDLKWNDATFVGLEATWHRSEVDQTLGVFRSDGTIDPSRSHASVSSTTEKLEYSERAVGLWLDQLLGLGWSVGASWQMRDIDLERRYPQIPSGAFGDSTLDRPGIETSLAHRIGLRAQYQHPSGPFVRAEGRWWLQDYSSAPSSPDNEFSENHFQLDFLLGWRFIGRRAEVAVGVLNVLDSDYRLHPLDLDADLPRERVWMARLSFSL